MTPNPASKPGAPRWLVIVVAGIAVCVFVAWLLTADDLNGLLGAGS